MSSDEDTVTGADNSPPSTSQQHQHQHQRHAGRSYESDDDDPVGLSDSSRSSSERIKKYVPPRLRKVWGAVVRWVEGPQPPRPYRIEPFFPRIQTAPLRLLDRFFPKRKYKLWLLVAFYACWLAAFASVLHASAFASDIPGYGAPVRLSCAARFWSDRNGCGLNGDGCRPFDNSTFTFRCPANCKRVQVINSHAVGAEEVIYRSLVIGGQMETEQGVTSEAYRSDSFICGAALHAGFMSNTDGGCGVLELVGEQQEYPSTSSNGIRSVSFDSYFPQSFRFVKGTASQCKDLRWPLLAVSLTFTVLLSLFTTSPLVFFASLFAGIFFHVALASDPPNMSNYYAIVSTALGRFLPAAFCAAAIYRFAVRRSLTDLTAQVEKTVLWLGACWVGALNNYTFDKIPIQRLTPHDLHQQPGAITALVIVVLVIFTIALGQAWALRVEGRMPRYLAIYVTMGVCLLLLVAVPRMNVRIHHYILALLLLPGTSMQNRPSLLYQGLLVGLFINGTARWGFDSILQTPAELRGDAKLGTLIPTVLEPQINAPDAARGIPANVTFEWASPLPDGWDGVSVLVNDVERFKGYEDEGPGKESFTWVRSEEHEGLPEYFRFAYLSGSGVGDYSKAGKWGAEYEWTPMEPGPSISGSDSSMNGDEDEGTSESGEDGTG
ncbi:hypothetical protein BDY21DRAFT_289516 [Lineolata rhizophorae]|uniref:LCCL domain-containing protein n=1 Tax=Lineolata rhizophorae TaxID=578093 RepID=A0A6A6NV50_9PEZI|nr:hypothetical protein BDY21DRAFT_289516 [Lineolata rhizophorae]